MPDQNLRQVKWVLWVILFANLAVAGVKIIAGELIASASLTADGFHSMTDGISNIVGLIGIQFAAQPWMASIHTDTESTSM
jgi:divalent metal cation (Fe/Co/Zn/Cd) transporter